MVLIGLDDEIVELEEGYFLGAVYCNAEGSLEARGMIKLNGLVDVVGRNADVLHPVVKSLIFIMNLCLDDCYDKTFCVFEDLETDDSAQSGNIWLLCGFHMPLA